MPESKGQESKEDKPFRVPAHSPTGVLYGDRIKEQYMGLANEGGGEKEMTDQKPCPECGFIPSYCPKCEEICRESKEDSPSDPPTKPTKEQGDYSGIGVPMEEPPTKEELAEWEMDLTNTRPGHAIRYPPFTPGPKDCLRLICRVRGLEEQQQIVCAHDELEAKISELMQENEQLRSQLSMEHTELSKCLPVDRSQGKVNLAVQVAAYVEELRSQVAGLRKQISDSYNAYADEFEKNKELRQENEKLKVDIDGLMFQLDQREKELDSYKEENERLKGELAQDKADNALKGGEDAPANPDG